jgi:hypothetical protein
MSISTSRMVVACLCSLGLSLTGSACGGGGGDNSAAQGADDSDALTTATGENQENSANSANTADSSNTENSTENAALAGCPVDSPTECTQEVHWADVAPVFEAHCATAGCHDGQSKLWPLRNYEHVADWSGEVRNRIAECTMPPVEALAQTPMPLEDRQLILQWIRCGFPG